MRLVLDTNVVISAVLGSTAPARLIELAAEGALDLFTSPQLLAELESVLSREHIKRRLEQRKRTPADVVALYKALVEQTVSANISRTAEDPDDDDVLACALAAGADLLVSGDKALRDLKSFHGIPILSPTDCLALVIPTSR